MSRKKKKNLYKIFLKSICIFFGIIIVIGLIINHFFISINQDQLSQENQDLGIDKELYDKYEYIKREDDEIINIALFGIDSRENSFDNSRSDTIIIASLDKKHKQIKLCSIMRDSYVDIPGHGMDKITHAYAYGGAELAIKTINQNFKLDIRDYIVVNFNGLEKIIDALGGVEIKIKDYEVQPLKSVGVKKTGVQLLNGKQALAYSRIRYYGGGDYERTQRQRTVLNGVIDNFTSMNFTKGYKVIKSILPNVKTSLSNTKIISYGTYVLANKITEIQNYRLPVSGYGNGINLKGIYYLEYRSLEDNVNFLHEFIY